MSDFSYITTVDVYVSALVYPKMIKMNNYKECRTMPFLLTGIILLKCMFCVSIVMHFTNAYVFVLLLKHNIEFTVQRTQNGSVKFSGGTNGRPEVGCLT